MTECECGFEVGDSVDFYDSEGEIIEVNHQSSDQCLLQVLTDDDVVKKLPSSLVEQA